MASNYIASASFDAVVGGSALRQELFTPTGSAYQTAEFVRASELASAFIKSAAHRAGYTGLGDSTTEDNVVLAAIGQLLIMAFPRKRQKVPAGLYQWILDIREDLMTGKLKLPSLTVAEDEGVGALVFTGHDEDVDGDHAPVFDRDFLDQY